MNKGYERISYTKKLLYKSSVIQALDSFITGEIISVEKRSYTENSVFNKILSNTNYQKGCIHNIIFAVL